MSSTHSCLNEVFQGQDGLCFEGRSTGFPALGSRGFNAVFCAFRYESSLEVCDGSEDVGDQLAGCGCGVDPFFEADQPDVLSLQVFDRFRA